MTSTMGGLPLANARCKTRPRGHPASSRARSVAPKTLASAPKSGFCNRPRKSARRMLVLKRALVAQALVVEHDVDDRNFFRASRSELADMHIAPCRRMRTAPDGRAAPLRAQRSETSRRPNAQSSMQKRRARLVALEVAAHVLAAVAASTTRRPSFGSTLRIMCATNCDLDRFGGVLGTTPCNSVSHSARALATSTHGLRSFAFAARSARPAMKLRRAGHAKRDGNTIPSGPAPRCDAKLRIGVEYAIFVHRQNTVDMRADRNDEIGLGHDAV